MNTKVKNSKKDTIVIPQVFQSTQKTPTEICDWLITYLVDCLEIEASSIDTSIEFAYFGLDSAGSMILLGELGDWLGQKIDPTIVYEYPNIDALANYLSAQN